MERSDSCAVPAASVVAEAVVAWEIANAIVEQFGVDQMDRIAEMLRNEKACEGVLMKSLQIETASLSYPVFIGGGIRKTRQSFVILEPSDDETALITDEEVDKRYGEELFSLLRSNGPSKGCGAKRRAGQIHRYVYEAPDGSHSISP
ncbi:hypothetical protein PO124_16080 [Bacillus licheniformis]|nr:hypothetical protein [Bacillus licheniformis]